MDSDKVARFLRLRVDPPVQSYVTKQTTDRRRAWNKCVLNHCLDCISSFNALLSYCRQWFSMHDIYCRDGVLEVSSTSRKPRGQKIVALALASTPCPRVFTSIHL